MRRFVREDDLAEALAKRAQYEANLTEEGIGRCKALQGRAGKKPSEGRGVHK
jgi:hypothetical protein